MFTTTTNGACFINLTYVITDATGRTIPGGAYPTVTNELGTAAPTPPPPTTARRDAGGDREGELRAVEHVPVHPDRRHRAVLGRHDVDDEFDVRRANPQTGIARDRR